MLATSCKPPEGELSRPSGQHLGTSGGGATTRGGSERGRHDDPPLRPAGRGRPGPRERRAAGRLDPSFGPARALVRAGLAERLAAAAADLPAGIAAARGGGPPQRGRPARDHRRATPPRSAPPGPGLDADELHRLTSRFVAPLEVAPHVAGAAVDLTLVDACGDELDLGTPIDATPEASDGRCFTAAAGIGADARAHRDLLARVLGGAGLGQLPHRVVALELRRPLLGAAHRRRRPRSTARSTWRWRHERPPGGHGGREPGRTGRAGAAGGHSPPCAPTSGCWPGAPPPR